MSEMVKRVAQALYANEYKGSTDAMTKNGWFVYSEAARAAIEAMIEPTLAMVSAGRQKDIDLSFHAGSEDHWEAMIKQALK